MKRQGRNTTMTRWLTALFLLTALGLAGCGGGGGGGGSSEPPTLTVTAAATVVQGQPASITLVGRYAPDPAVPLTYSVAGAPRSLVLNAATGVCTWTPAYDEIGTQTMKFTVSNGYMTASRTVSVWVLPDSSVDSTTALPGGTLDPLVIPKYVTPLFILPVMKDKGAANEYALAMRQFRQQILPGGIWSSLTGRLDGFPATPVWGYGPGTDPAPDSSSSGGGAGIAPASNSQFNYPAYTVETQADVPVKVRWINDLVDAGGNYLPPLTTVDQNLHWANPPQACADGRTASNCEGANAAPYAGPVPTVIHLHGAHVAPHSDGYPEAWWLPAAKNIPAGYARAGSLFDDSTGANPGTLGFADYLYRNDQTATTLWFHDHALGMTRNNIYSGLAGFWLIRGNHTPPAGGGPPVPDAVDDSGTAALNDGVLPGPAPAAGNPVMALNTPGNPVRNAVRELPLMIQDRSFNADGSLFYPSNRAFFEGLNPARLRIRLAPDSDIPPQWNPEVFFNVMVVNGVSWPKLDVARSKYRFRLLNACNSRFLNLALFVVNPATGRIDRTREVPFYVIGTDQGPLPNVVKITTGFATPLPGNGTIPAAAAAPDPDQALLLALSERVDVIVDFAGLADGTIVRMINTAPDEPFGGFNGAPGEDAVADPLTTGQVMQFVVNNALTGASRTDPNGANPATAVERLVLNPEAPPGPTTRVRQISLNEMESTQVCVVSGDDGITQLTSVAPAANEADVPRFKADCEAAGGVPYAPQRALLGTVDLTDPDSPVGVPLRWMDMSGASTAATVTMMNGSTRQISVTENPTLGDVEEWEIYDFTEDAHPIHLHLVKFKVISRRLFDGSPSPHGSVQPWETGYKDTVIAYPGEITRVKARFDIAGLYVWHCHILEHEDNEMMRPYVVSP